MVSEAVIERMVLFSCVCTKSFSSPNNRRVCLSVLLSTFLPRIYGSLLFLFCRVN